MTAAAACGGFAAGHPSGRQYQSIVHLQQMWRTAGVKCQSSTAHSSTAAKASSDTISFTAGIRG